MKHSATLPVLVVFLLTPPAFAVDTLEPFENGLSDAELYVGVKNIGGPQAEATPFLVGGVGAGLAERISLFVGYAAAGDGYLTRPSHVVYGSLFGNVGTWEPISFDLGLSLNKGEGSLQTAPFFELNWDFAPKQAIAGVFLHGGPTAVSVGTIVDWAWEQGLGGYYTTGEGKQLFLEWATGYDLGRYPAKHAFKRGSLLAGFNCVVTDSLELITEAGVTIPQKGTPTRLQALVGFVATLPDPQ